MKITPLLIFLISFNLLHSQSITGIVKNSVTGDPIPYSNIVLKNGKGTYSSESGTFKLQTRNLKDNTLKISSIGYESKLLSLTAYKNNNFLEVLLQPKTEALDEVILSNKRIKYTDKTSIEVRKKKNVGFMTLIGYETALLFENPKHKNGKLKKIYIELKKRRDADYIATLNFKFYEFDKINNRPGKMIYTENIYIKPKNKKYRLWVDVEDFDIKFPKDGVCIGVEMVNTYGTVEKYANFGPMFRYTLDEDNTHQLWSNYHNSGWKTKALKHFHYSKTKQYKTIPLMGIEVLYAK